jgi:hypothetical protein
VASVLYHDSFWYPANAERRMKAVLDSPWGRLFENWERLTPTAEGFPEVGAAPTEITHGGWRAFGQSMGILGTCIREAPEFARRPPSPPATSVPPAVSTGTEVAGGDGGRK